MNQEEQAKKTSQVISDATVKEDLVIPAKPTDLSDEDLDKVAGGIATVTVTVISVNDAPTYTIKSTTTK